MYSDSTLTHLPNVYKILNEEKGGNYDKKLLLSAIFLTTVLFSGLNHSIYAQVANTVELETLNPEQVKNIIRVNSENDLPKDGTTYTLVYSKQHCKLPDETENTSDATQKKTTESAPQTTTLTTVLKAQVKQSLPQTGTQKSIAVVLTAGVLVGLAFLMIKYHKKKVWMVLLITASVTSLYNLRNVMAENETKITTIPVTTFVPTSDHCLYGYIIIPKNSETTKFETSKGEPLVFEKPEFEGGVPGMPEVHEKPEFEGGVPGMPEVYDKPEFKGGVPGMPEVYDKPEFNGGVVPNEAPIHDISSIVVTTTTAVTATEATVTTVTTTTSTEPTTTTNASAN